MADKFEDLRTFVAIVSRGGVNAAAAQLGIAKSAVSRRLSDLEARLGVTLVERSRRGFEVTATGRGYFERAVDLLGRLEELDADPASQRAAGAISLAAPVAVARHLLPPPLSTFLSSRDGLSLGVVGEGERADVTVETSDHGTDGRRVAEFSRILCAAPAYVDAHGAPGSTDELAAHAGVMLAEQRGAWRTSPSATRRPRAAITVADADVALAMTLEGSGISQLPDFVARSGLADGSLVSILGGATPPGGWVVARAAEDAPRVAHALIDHLVDALSDKSGS